MSRRVLSLQERIEAELVFRGSMDLNRVIVHEDARWTSLPGRIGAWLRGGEPPAANAVTLLNCVYFPRPLPDLAGGVHSHRELMDTAWLIHELTHVWQYQNRGLLYVLSTVWLHIRSRFDIYCYDGEAELVRRAQEGQGFLSFNQEQQGEITRDYYLRLKKGLESNAWEPFMEEIRGFPG